MYYWNKGSQNVFSNPIQNVSLIEPYVVQTLQNIIGKRVIVDTVRGTIQGNLIDVKPDHIVLRDNKEDQPTYIRIQQIVYVIPIDR